MSTVNVARIPNTNVPVAINTVNGGAPTGGGQASNCLSANPNYVAHSIYFNNNPSLNAVNFNGYTRVFQAEAEVVCGNTYHIKLAITDVVDGALNSAVFLGENSFKSPTYKFTPIPNANNSFVDTALVEGCSVTPLILEKQGSFLGKDVATTIKTSGTAIEGVDYLQITDSVFMPSGKRFDTIYIQGINDGLVEGVETIILDFEQVMTGCSFSLKGSHTLYLRDKTPLQASIAIGSATDTIKCPTDSILLTVTASGGDGVSFLGWLDDPTLTSPNRYVSPPNNTTYYFYFTDECNTDTVIDSIQIYTLLNDPLALAEQEYVVCDGDRIVLEPEISGGSPPYVISWFNNSNLSTVEVQPISDTNWIAYSVTDFCGVQLFDSILVARDTGIKPNFESEIDFGDPLTVSFLSDPALRISYLWDFGDGNISTDKDPTHTYDDPGQYNVTLTVLTPDSCIKQVSRVIEVEEIYELYIPNAFTPNGDSKNDFFTIQGTGIENYEIMIFNRWGKLVFQSSDIENAWDGRFNGTTVQSGVYSYRISVTTTFGGKRERRGTLTLYN
jgi:gliding motility-associated-like protein